jgi:type VI protein secretion system component Hcp
MSDQVYYLKIEGIRGDSKASRYTDWIELYSFEYEGFHSHSSSSSTNAREPVFGHFVTRHGSATVGLARAWAERTNFKEAIIAGMTFWGGEFLRFAFRDVTVISVGDGPKNDYEVYGIRFGTLTAQNGPVPASKLTDAQARSLIQWSINKLKHTVKDAVGKK